MHQDPSAQPRATSAQDAPAHPDDSWSAGALPTDDSGVYYARDLERPGAALRAHRSDLLLLVITLIAGIGMAAAAVLRSPSRPRAARAETVAATTRAPTPTTPTKPRVAALAPQVEPQVEPRVTAPRLETAIQPLDPPAAPVTATAAPEAAPAAPPRSTTGTRPKKQRSQQPAPTRSLPPAPVVETTTPANPVVSLETEALEELPSVSDEEPDALEDDFRDLDLEPEPEPELEPDSE